MSLTMFCKLLMLLGLLATDTCSKRISRSPKYLFSSDSNSLDELPEEAFAVSEDPSERLGSSSEKVEERYSRVRRSSGGTSSVPGPHVTPSVSQS